MAQKLPVLSEEESNLAIEISKLASHPKLARWLQLFLDKTNKQQLDTWGNRTWSAIHAYNLDANDPRQYATASVIGSQNFRKLKIAGTMYYDLQGMNAAKVLDLIAAHAVTKGGKALEMLAAITDVYEPRASISIQNNQTVVNNTAQASLDDAKAFSDKFEQFIDAEYSTPSSQSDLPETVG